MTRTLALFLLAVLAAPLAPRGGRASAPTDPVLARAQSEAPKVPKLVLALYYPWYGLSRGGAPGSHVEGIDAEKKQIGSFAHYPAAGPYDSLDEATLARHFRELRGAGVDAIAVSWWGAGDRTDGAFRRLLPVAGKAGLKACLYVETLPGGGATDGLARSLQQTALDPAYLRAGGRPVVFFYSRARAALPDEGWADALVDLQRRNPPGLLAIADGNRLIDALLFDGLHEQNPVGALVDAPAESRAARAEASARALVDLCRRRHRISVATVSPGLDDRKVAQPGAFLDRQQGRVWRESWAAALAARPDWVLVHSFNQWHDGTEIEPSIEYGDEYLRTCGEFAARFKRGPGEASAAR